MLIVCDVLPLLFFGKVLLGKDTNEICGVIASAYIGDIKYDTYSQPLILTYPLPEVGRLSFTSYHASPTGWQNLYIYPAEYVLSPLLSQPN